MPTSFAFVSLRDDPESAGKIIQFSVVNETASLRCVRKAADTITSQNVPGELQTGSGPLAKPLSDFALAIRERFFGLNPHPPYVSRPSSRAERRADLEQALNREFDCPSGCGEPPTIVRRYLGGRITCRRQKRNGRALGGNAARSFDGSGPEFKRNDNHRSKRRDGPRCCTGQACAQMRLPARMSCGHEPVTGDAFSRSKTD
jgi:hypothetical protein